MIPKALQPQTDFSGGEVDASAKRGDDALMRTCARQMSNWRILNTKKASNRPGRSVRFLPDGTRVDEVLMSAGNTFYLAFGNGTLKVYSYAGALLYSQSSQPWTTATVKNIVWDVYNMVIYIAFTGVQPKTLTWDGASTWTLGTYTETMRGGQKRTLFYRLSPKDVTMTPASYTGTGVACTFSTGMNLTSGHIGTRLRYAGGSQVTIASVTNATTCTIDIQQELPRSLEGTLTSWIGTFEVGDLVIGSVSGAKAIVISWNSGTGVFRIQLLTGSPNVLYLQDAMVGPSGSGSFSSSGAPSLGNPQAITVWDDEVMNSLRGWPQSVFIDQNRLGFCNFQSVPSGIAWSAIGLFTDLYVGATPEEAIFELAPNKSTVLYVVPGMESSEFVFADNAIYYIPITTTNPLKPGSVAFQVVSSNGVQQVQPRRVKETIIFIGAGNNTTIMALVAIGSYTRPYEARAISDQRSHLFNSPTCLAAPTADDTFPEDYLYVVNADGTLAIGKYEIQNGQIKGEVGWVPWSGGGTVKWASTLAADVILTASYAPNGIAAVTLVEAINDNYYLDSAMLVNAAPTAMAAPPGSGPLWWLPSGTVDLYDIATTGRPRMMGTYQIDASGNLVAQFTAGEDLTSLTLVAGQPWTATLEPFIPQAPGGQDMQQRMKTRRVARARVSVQNSTGFRFDKLYGGKAGPNLPAIASVLTTRRITAWNQDDDPTTAPTLREQSYNFRPVGRSDDPRVAIVKDTLGPLIITEFATEVTV